MTAHDQYAVKAFEVHAQDYLLKPFDADRFCAAFNRAAERISTRRPNNAAGSQLQAMLDHWEQQRTRRTRVRIRSEGRVTFIPVAEIDRIESSDNHVEIHANRQTYVVRQTLLHMEQSLPAADFVRVHRSSLVSVARIRKIQPWFNGEYVVLLYDGTQVRTSRGYRARLESLMS